MEFIMETPHPFPIPGENGERIDPETGLPLLDPFPDYVVCPHCGEAEVEVWCFQEGGACHNCGKWVHYPKPPFCGVAPYCKRGEKENPATADSPGPTD
jgi:hypothetical protein